MAEEKRKNFSKNAEYSCKTQKTNTLLKAPEAQAVTCSKPWLAKTSNH